MNDDAALVELAKSGSQEAFAELYERYFDRVYDFLARMVHDSSEAADLTQDAFIKAMNSLGTLSKGTSFKSWLFTIARNTALNRLERASRTQPLEGTDDAGEEQRYDVIDEDRFGNPEEAAEANSLASVVWEAAAALDPKYRSVLLLNLREGLDSAEIADVMGVTKNHAYVLVNRMKSALESAVGAVALFRNGRRLCAELDAVVSRLQVAELSPEARRVIERHAGTCPTCKEQKSRLSSPFAIVAGLTLLQPAPGIKEGIWGGLQQALSALPAGDGGATGATGSDGASGADGANKTTGLENAGGQAGPGTNGNGASHGSGAGPATNGNGASQTAGHESSAAGNGNQGAGQASSGPSSEEIRPAVDGSDGGSDFDDDRAPATATGDGAENNRGGRRRALVLGVIAALLLLAGAPLVALSFFAGNEDVGETEQAAVQETQAAVQETPTPAPTLTVTRTPTPVNTATATSTLATQAAVAPTETSTPASPTTSPIPAQQGPEGPSIAPGGDGGSDPGATGPPPAAPGAPDGSQPGEGVPPGITPDPSNAPPAGNSGDVTPPEPDGSDGPGTGSDPGEGSPSSPDPEEDSPTESDPPEQEEETEPDPGREREPPSLTADPCTPSLSASPSSLVFSPRNTHQTVVLRAEGCGAAVPFTAMPSDSWLFVIPPSGTIPDGGSASIIVEVDLQAGAGQSGRVHIESAAGSLDILVEVNAPEPDPDPIQRSDDLQQPCGVNCVTPVMPPPRFTN